MNTQNLMEKMELMKHNLPFNDEGKQRLAQIKRRKASEEQIREIEKWFAEYDCKVMQYNRCQRLGMPCDHNIIELDILAREKQAIIKALRENKHE